MRGDSFKTSLQLHSWLFTDDIKSQKTEPRGQTDKSGNVDRLFVSKTLMVENVYHAQVKGEAWKEKKTTLLPSTHRQNICTSFHGNTNLEKGNRPLGTSILITLRGKYPEVHPKIKRGQMKKWHQKQDTRCDCVRQTRHSAGRWAASQTHLSWPSYISAHSGLRHHPTQNA